MYRHSGLLCTPQNFAQSLTFLVKKKCFGTKVISEAFLSMSQILKDTRLRVAHKQNFELVDETLVFQGHLNVFLRLIHGFAELQ